MLLPGHAQLLISIFASPQLLSFIGVVALNAMLRLDGKLNLFKLLDEPVYLRIVFDRSSQQCLKLCTHARIVLQQI